MKTAEEYLDEAIRALPAFDRIPLGAACVYNVAIEAMKAYAKAYAEADRKDCAEKAKTMCVKLDYIGLTWEVDKASILNRPYPELL